MAGNRIDVVSSTLLFGAGIASAFYMLLARVHKEPRVVFWVVRHVVIADWLFTLTTIVVQPITGFYVAHRAGMPLQSAWLAWSIALYLVAGACWLPVVWMQIRMRDMARPSTETKSALPAAYRAYLRTWVMLGIIAFVALLVVFYLMVAKPV